MRTIFMTEDVKNVVETIFNGNLALYKASNGEVEYNNPNSEKIVIKEANDGLETEQDLAQYLNVKFYNWKERLVSTDETYFEDGASLSVFDSWVQSLNVSMNEAYALVEKIDEEVTNSQDIDSATITGRITFLIQADKIKNLDYYVSKLRNIYLGNPQDIQNSFGDIIKAYIMVGTLIYDQEPITTQLGETMVVSCNFRISYLNDALSYNDTKVEISLDGDDIYNESGEIVGTTKYLEMPLTKITWQNVFTSKAVPTAERPDLTGYVASSLSNVKTFTFYDFNKTLSMRFNDLFWSCNCIREDGVLSAIRSVNIPVFVRVTSNGHKYVYKDMIDQMQKVITNNDFNISSITLKGWGKIEQIGE